VPPLLHPRFAWGSNGQSRDLNGPALDSMTKKHHVPNRAEWPQGFHAEEIAGVERSQCSSELLPGPLPLALRCRLIPSSSRMLATVVSSDLDLQSVRRASRIFPYIPSPDSPGHSDHQLADVLLLPWSTDLLLRAVVFLAAAIWRNHPKERPRLHDLAALLPRFRAQSFGRRRRGDDVGSL